MVNAKFKKSGKTELILESPNRDKITFNITIKRDTYDITKKISK